MFNPFRPRPLAPPLPNDLYKSRRTYSTEPVPPPSTGVEADQMRIPDLSLEGLEEYTRVRSRHQRDGWVTVDAAFLDALVAEALESRRHIAALDKALEALRNPIPLEIGDYVEGWDELKDLYRGTLAFHAPGFPQSVIVRAQVKDLYGRWVPVGGERKVYKQGLHRYTPGSSL